MVGCSARQRNPPQPRISLARSSSCRLREPSYVEAKLFVGAAAPPPASFMGPHEVVGLTPAQRRD